MKMSLALFLATSFLSFSAQARTETICGTFQVKSSDGVMTVIKNVLVVSSGPMTPAFTEVELSASGTSMDVIDRAQKVIASLEVGYAYCVTGNVTNRPNFDLVMVPESAELQ